MPDRFPFDRNSPGAQKLARHQAEYLRSSQPMDVVVTTPLVQHKGDRGSIVSTAHKTGDRLTVTRAEGESMIERGVARRD